MANTFLLHSLLLTYLNCAPLSFLACRSFHRRQVPVPGLSSFPSLTRHLILLHSTLRLISVCVSRLCLISPALPYLPAFQAPHPPPPPTDPSSSVPSISQYFPDPRTHPLSFPSSVYDPCAGRHSRRDRCSPPYFYIPRGGWVKLKLTRECVPILRQKLKPPSLSQLFSDWHRWI